VSSIESVRVGAKGFETEFGAEIDAAPLVFGAIIVFGWNGHAAATHQGQARVGRLNFRDRNGFFGHGCSENQTWFQPAGSRGAAQSGSGCQLSHAPFSG
jgi:hypothetical protein